MNRQKNKFLILGLLLTIYSCATTLTPDQIVQKANAINYEDGIDEDEAILIAQKYLIDNDLASTYSIYELRDYGLDSSGTFRMVNFGGVIVRRPNKLRRFDFTPSISIKVDSKNGQVEIVEKDDSVL